MHAANKSSGIAVYIMNHSQMALRDARFISPGMRTTFLVRRAFEMRLPSPHSDCRTNVTGSEMIDGLKRQYFQAECLDYCPFYLIAARCDRLDEFLEFSHLFYTGNYDLFRSEMCNCLVFWLWLINGIWTMRKRKRRNTESTNIPYSIFVLRKSKFRT